MSFLRFRRYLRSRLEVVQLSTRATFGVDAELEKRQSEARARLPENSVKPVIDWPRDANGSPIDYDAEPPPV